jgi:hypothetical protein
MTVISPSHQISTGLARSCEHDRFATCSVTWGFKAHLITFFTGSARSTWHRIRSILLPLSLVALR